MSLHLVSLSPSLSLPLSPSLPRRRPPLPSFLRHVPGSQLLEGSELMVPAGVNIPAHRATTGNHLEVLEGRPPAVPDDVVGAETVHNPDVKEERGVVKMEVVTVKTEALDGPTAPAELALPKPAEVSHCTCQSIPTAVSCPTVRIIRSPMVHALSLITIALSCHGPRAQCCGRRSRTRRHTRSPRCSGSRPAGWSSSTSTSRGSLPTPR